MAIITVSRTHGSAGTMFAGQVAERLGYSVHGSELLRKTHDLARSHYCDVCAEEPEHPSFLERFEELMSNRNFHKTMLLTCVYDLAMKGDAVFVGMGAQVILEGLPDALHLFVVRRRSDRVRAIAQVKHISYDEADHLIRKMDEGKKEFISHYFDRNAEEPTLYHLTINSSTVPLGYAVDMVEAYVTRCITPEQVKESGRILAGRFLEKKAELSLFALDMVHDFGKITFEAKGEGVLAVKGVVGGEQGKEKLLATLKGLDGVAEIEDHLKIGVLSHIIY
jgi:cytidylate kinase